MTRPADLAIIDSRIRTGLPSFPWTDALAARDGQVVALGTADVRPLIGPSTRVLHRPDGVVLPGFQDAHVHPPFAGLHRLTVDLTDLPGRAAYVERVAEYARATAGDPHEWIRGGGWAMEHFPGGAPHKHDLDAVVAERPVFLFNRDLHGAWLNSAALRLAGITSQTPDPPDGRIERDPDTGEPTGLLHEGAAHAVNARVLPQPDTITWQAAILDAQQHLLSLGITTWQDAWVTPATAAAYRALASDGRLTGRVVGALWWERERGPDQIESFVAERAKGTDGAFRPTSVKIMLDGVLENRTGALIDPYLHTCCAGPSGSSDHGLAHVPRDVLLPAVTELDRLGFQVHLHTIGDRAVRDALDAIEAARRANGPTGADANRHHLAHVQIVQPDDIHRFAALGVTATCQTFWAQSEPQMDDLTVPVIGAERARLQYPFASLARAGARLALGSDWPVTTADPLAQLEVAMTRTSPAHRDQSPFLPGQRLSLEQALDAFTSGSAWVNHDESGGTLAIGARADLVLLDRDIFAAGGILPTDASVTHTIVSGRVVFER